MLCQSGLLHVYVVPCVWSMYVHYSLEINLELCTDMNILDFSF